MKFTSAASFIAATVVAVSADSINFKKSGMNAQTEDSLNVNAPPVIYFGTGRTAMNLLYTVNGTSFPLYTITIVNQGTNVSTIVEQNWNVTSHVVLGLNTAFYTTAQFPDNLTQYQVKLIPVPSNMTDGTNGANFTSGNFGIARGAASTTSSGGPSATTSMAPGASTTPSTMVPNSASSLMAMSGSLFALACAVLF